MKTYFAAAMLTSLLAVSACQHTPVHNLSRGTLASAIQLIDAPAGAVLSAEGLSATADEDGAARLVVADGWHDVKVTQGGTQIHSERIFVQDGSARVIDLQP